MFTKAIAEDEAIDALAKDRKLSLYLSDTEATEGENGPESSCLSVIQWARL